MSYMVFAAAAFAERDVATALYCTLASVYWQKVLRGWPKVTIKNAAGEEVTTYLPGAYIKAALDAYEDAHPGPVSDGSGPSHPND